MAETHSLWRFNTLEGVIDEWIGGVVALNRGTSLLRPDLINAGDYTNLKRRVEQYLQHIREAKSRAKK
jgi:2-keto-3-deoxy-6-phosphogluconate aldolase